PSGCTLFPCTTLFRSVFVEQAARGWARRQAPRMPLPAGGCAMVGFDARVVGANVHANRLRRMRNAQYMQRELVKELMVEGEEIRKEIQDSIRAGGIPSPNHVPSAPGQPPNADTHNLDLSIDVRVPRASGRTSLVVIAQAEYAAALEFG